MSTTVDKAAEAFSTGHNCAQSVLLSVCEEFGMDRPTAISVAEGFGGGMCNSSQACGAVTGAIMAIGLQHNRHADAENGKARAAKTVQEFMQRFHHAHGAISCTDLLGLDLGVPGNHEKAHDMNLFRERCPQFVRGAAALLEDTLLQPSTEG